MSLQEKLDSLMLDLIRGTDLDDFLERSDRVTLPLWPEFMLHDTYSNRYWNLLFELTPEFQFALCKRDTEEWIAVGNSVPVSFTGDLTTLPDKGWDWALQTGIEGARSGVKPNLLCALAIQVDTPYQGDGLSPLLIEVMKELGVQAGLERLIAPVRPNCKPDYPLLPMDDYIEWKQGEWPFDPWLRVHARLGASILKACPQAMHIEGTLKDWESWTGLSFRNSGEYIIPGALHPVRIDVENDRGTYIESNVWMVHEFEQ